MGLPEQVRSYLQRNPNQRSTSINIGVEGRPARPDKQTEMVGKNLRKAPIPSADWPGTMKQAANKPSEPYAYDKLAVCVWTAYVTRGSLR